MGMASPLKRVARTAIELDWPIRMDPDRRFARTFTEGRLNCGDIIIIPCETVSRVLHEVTM